MALKMRSSPKIKDKAGSNIYFYISIQSKKEGKDQESMQSSTTPDPGYQWESDNFTNESQEVSPFPAGDQKATINRRAQKA